jgi:drug/metabolite transporter (DMT)-like permease
MKMSNKYAQPFYIVFGFIFLLFSLIFSSASITTGVFPVGQELVTFGVSVMAFCLAYLYPQFKENDERSKLIREKGMFYSYFIIMGFLIIISGLFQFNVINLNGIQTVYLIQTLIIITVFLSFVVLSKKR